MAEVIPLVRKPAPQPHSQPPNVNTSFVPSQAGCATPVVDLTLDASLAADTADLYTEVTDRVTQNFRYLYPSYHSDHSIPHHSTPTSLSKFLRRCLLTVTNMALRPGYQPLNQLNDDSNTSLENLPDAESLSEFNIDNNANTQKSRESANSKGCCASCFAKCFK